MTDLLTYFAYGSNLHPGRLIARLGDLEERGAAVLPDHRLTFDKFGGDTSGKCTIQPSPGHTVHGALYGITADQRAVLDVIEGARYAVRPVRVRAADTVLDAFTYVALAEHTRPGLAPFDWYRELVVRGALHHGFPAAYVAALRAVAAVPDPDPDRAALNAALLTTLT